MSGMKIVVLSTSLKPQGRSHSMAVQASEILTAAGAEVEVVELGETNLPVCGMPGSFEHAGAMQLTSQIKEADAVLVVTPVYNYDANAACKNAIELTGRGWENKVVGFICSAGGNFSFMSIMSLANSLMLDFRCIIVPRFLYVTGAAFAGGELVDPDIQRRLEGLCRELVRLAQALSLPA